MFRDYLILFKARLCGMVLITTAVGFLVAPSSEIAWGRLFAVLVGTGLAAFGANALNQWLERDLDLRMHRTRRRPLPAGRLSSRQALTAGVGVSVAGPLVLWVGAGWLPAAIALGTILLYVLVYTPLKRRSTLNTAVGAVSGALPPVIGWAGAGQGLGLGAGLLFALLFLWQMPHFFALAWMYREDYARGGFRMLPVVDPRGRLTFPVAAVFALLLLPLGLIVTVAGLAGIWFAIGSLVLGAWWSVLSLRLARSGSDRDARRVFLASLAYLPLVLGLMVIDRGPASGGGVAVARAAEDTR
jgi:heme o synthase